jgi:hypothetical protein
MSSTGSLFQAASLLELLRHRLEALADADHFYRAASIYGRIVMQTRE